MPGMVEAMKTMKDASLALLSEQQIKLATPYFDYLIQGMQTST
ncbi:MAG: allophycocyanin, partial [Synechococcus sp.]|nr:allophycocyanin [Synechococcus sp.]